MKAFIRSMKSAAEGSMDTVQIRVNEDEMVKNGAVLLQLKKYHHVTVNAEANQAELGDDGAVSFPTIEFQAQATAFLVSVLPNGQSATLTFSVSQEDEVVTKVIKHRIKGVPVDITFAEGEAPNND